MIPRADAVPATRVVLWGATGHAKVLRECLAHAGVDVAAVCDRAPVPPPFDDVPLLVGEQEFRRWLTSLPSSDPLGFLVAIGGAQGKDRLERHAFLEQQGLHASRAIHPTAFVADNARIGPGSQVLALAAVCVDVSIGRSCIVNTGAAVDHECEIGDGAHLAPGARLAGLVRVGARAMVGMGAVVVPRVSIGHDAIVGAGALVLHDVPPGTIVYGCPARVIRHRDDAEVS